MTGLSNYTLRYYDKEGLLPFVKRNINGRRQFNNHDLSMIQLICCLKETGMSIKEIRAFIEWSMAGDSTLELRLQMFQEHKKDVEIKMSSIQRNLDKINHKIHYYHAAVEAGTEAGRK